jgi:hypothetical protein
VCARKQDLELSTETWSCEEIAGAGIQECWVANHSSHSPCVDFERALLLDGYGTPWVSFGIPNLPSSGWLVTAGV